LARDAEAKLALIVAQCLSIHLSICVSVRDSLSHAYVRSIARREPPRLPACTIVHRPQFIIWYLLITRHQNVSSACYSCIVLTVAWPRVICTAGYCCIPCAKLVQEKC